MFCYGRLSLLHLYAMSVWRKIPAVVWQLGLVTLLGLPLLAPLLRWTAVACTHDGHLHYHRVAAMRHAWENGLYFSRWLPDLAFGYGYPFFVYREPTPLYAALLPHLLGLPLPAAENLFYALCILACGWFMFLWVRDIFGPRAGIVAGVAYMSAPYVLIDALVRGNAPESLALPLLPFLLWAGRRWLLTGKGRWFLTTIGVLAFFSLSHNISLLIFTPTFLIYLLTLAILHKVERRTAVLRILTIFILGLGLTVFYSAGALLEMDAVTLTQSTTTRNNDFHYNFASLGEILAPVTPEDPALINPPLLFRLGWVTVGMAVLGVVSLYFYWRPVNGRRPLETGANKERAVHIVLMAVATAVFLFMSLSISLPFWENLPLIDFTQFPWRFVGRAALPLAMLAGAPFVCLDDFAKGKSYPKAGTALRILFFISIPLLIIETVPNLYPNECREDPFPTILTVFDYEHGTGLVGVDPEGSYFPRTVQKRPSASPLETDYQAGLDPQRFDITSLPQGASVDSAVYTPLTASLQVTTPEAFTAVYQTFAFPGWQVLVDGEPAAITPSDPAGLITFTVPAGTHEIEVRWASTPLRSGLVALSVLALLGVIGIIVFGNRLPVIGDRSLPKPTNCLLPTDYWSLIIIALLLLGLKLVIDRSNSPLRRPGTPPITEMADLQAAELRLNGFNLSRTEVESGGTFDIDMAWTAVEVPRTSYQTNVWLVDDSGLIWSDKETFRPRLYEDTPSTIFWQPGQWAWDSREVQTLSGTPPGRYDIVLTVFDRETLQPLTLVTDAGQVIGPTAVIGQIDITPTAEPQEFQAQYPQDAAVPGTGRTLLGYNQDRSKAAPGNQLLLTLFWQGGEAAKTGRLHISLLDDAESVAAAWEYELASLTDAARERGQYLLDLPGDLADGRYQFRLNDTVLLGSLTIDGPERSFVRPPVETAVAATFTLQDNPLATLSGITFTNLQEPITLLWQAENQFPANYRVFIHLVAENGEIIAQADGEPAGWTRPTTGWAAGEYILDQHELSLPDSLPDPPYTLRIGLYEPSTGQRLQTETADYATIQLP